MDYEPRLNDVVAEKLAVDVSSLQSTEEGAIGWVCKKLSAITGVDVDCKIASLPIDVYDLPSEGDPFKIEANLSFIFGSLRVRSLHFYIPVSAHFASDRLFIRNIGGSAFTAWIKQMEKFKRIVDKVHAAGLIGRPRLAFSSNGWVPQRSIVGIGYVLSGGRYKSPKAYVASVFTDVKAPVRVAVIDNHKISHEGKREAGFPWIEVGADGKLTEVLLETFVFEETKDFPHHVSLSMARNGLRPLLGDIGYQGELLEELLGEKIW